uniref:hypothetical protein n=1 Tax=Escherichia coli TaxID=562 RepID=UPI00164980D5
IHALPLIDVTYDVPLSDELTTPADRPVRFTRRAGHQAGADAHGAWVTKVEYSIDRGTTWHTAAVSNDGGTARVRLPGLPAGPVNLRTSAVDRQGGELVETLTNAFLVR